MSRNRGGGPERITGPTAAVCVRLVQLRQKQPVFKTVTASTGDWRVGFMGNEAVSLTVGLD